MSNSLLKLQLVFQPDNHSTVDQVLTDLLSVSLAIQLYEAGSRIIASIGVVQVGQGLFFGEGEFNTVRSEADKRKAQRLTAGL